jgi:undecaprenyl-diphosphatase
VTPRSLPWRTLLLFAFAALATFAVVVLAEAVLEGRADAPDRAAALWIHHHLDTPLRDKVMIAVTNLGSNPALILAVTITCIWLLRHAHRRTALILVVDAITAGILDQTLKFCIARPRPTLFDEITRPETFSFPSGHAMMSMVVYGGIAAALVVHRPWRKPWLIGGTALLILAIGFSRVYLGVHWPFDVLAGYAAGSVFVATTVHLLHTRAKASSASDRMNIYSPA